MGFDPYLLSDPAFYKAIEEAIRGNIPGGETFEALIRDAIREIGGNGVMFGFHRGSTSAGDPLPKENMWSISLLEGVDPSIRSMTPFTGKFQDMVISVTSNDLDEEMEVTLLTDGFTIGPPGPLEHSITYAAGETGIKILTAQTTNILPVGSRMSFRMNSPASNTGSAQASGSILLK